MGTTDRPSTKNERVIKTLYDIVANDTIGHEQKVASLLTLGCERFGLEIGVFTKVDGDLCSVVQTVHPADVSLSSGDQFKLSNTYCSLTLEANDLVSIDHIGNSQLRTHPAYAACQLEAYIGIPITIDKKAYGTLSFSSALPRNKKFSASETDATLLMATWLTSSIKQIRKERELKLAYSNLALAEEKFRLTIDASPTGMIMIDRSGQIVLINKQTRAMFDYTHDELVGQLIECLLPDEIRAHHPPYRDGFFESPESRVMGLGRELTGKKKNGETFPLEIGLNPILIQDRAHVLCSVIDITERKRHDRLIIKQAQKAIEARQLKETNKLLRHQALRDSLTNLHNRRSFFEQIEQILAIAHQNDQSISIFMIDLDHFKAYNDDFGHPAGDCALKTAANIIVSESRNADIVARYGGEEFIVCLPETNVLSAITSAERIRCAVNAIDTLERRISASFGVATLSLNSTNPLKPQQVSQDLIDRADKALYHAKHTGRDKVCHYNNVISGTTPPDIAPDTAAVSDAESIV